MEYKINIKKNKNVQGQYCLYMYVYFSEGGSEMVIFIYEETTMKKYKGVVNARPVTHPHTKTLYSPCVHQQYVRDFHKLNIHSATNFLVLQ